YPAFGSRKHFIDYYSACIGFTYFYHYIVAAIGHVCINAWHDVAHYAVKRLPVPYRKYARSIASYFKYCSGTMVLCYSKSCYAKRAGLWRSVERNTYPDGHGSGIYSSESEKF